MEWLLVKVLQCLSAALLACMLCCTAVNGQRSAAHDPLHGQSRDYCPHERFEPSCAGNEVIIVERAIYGRMRAGRCISSEYKLGCSKDVTSHLGQECTGKQNCSMFVPTLELIARPCSDDLKSYLTAQYKCVEVTSTDDCIHGNQTLLRGPSGYLLVHGSRPNRPQVGRSPDTSHCPWVIQVEQGRRINVTHVREAADIAGLQSYPDCPFQLEIRDGRKTSLVEGCRRSGDTSANTVYSSETSEIIVKVVWRNTWEKSRGSPLLRYEAFGCEDFAPPEGTNMERHGDSAMVMCNATHETWYLTCDDSGEWKGTAGNCTSGILVAVLIGVVLGIVVGALMLFLIYLLKKSRRSNNRASIPHAVESHYETRGYLTEGTAAYPALLCQEKPCGPHACEYTHVWNVQPGNMCSVSDMTYAAATVDGRQPQTPKSQRAPPANNRTPSHTSTFTSSRKPKPSVCSKSASMDSCDAATVEQISLSNLRPSAAEPREGFTPAYYELEAKLRNSKNQPPPVAKRDDFSDFHVVFKDNVDAL